MPIITVVKAFTLATEGGGKLHYTPGEYEVDDATAEHWFVQAHLAGFVEPMPEPGTAQYAQRMLNVEQAVRNATPVAPNLQPPAPLLPDVVRVASRTGLVPEDTHFFAGGPQEDKPMPGQDEGPSVSFVRSAAPRQATAREA